MRNTQVKLANFLKDSIEYKVHYFYMLQGTSFLLEAFVGPGPVDNN